VVLPLNRGNTDADITKWVTFDWLKIGHRGVTRNPDVFGNLAIFRGSVYCPKRSCFFGGKERVYNH